MNKYLFSLLKVVRKVTPLSLAAIMLFNISTEAFAQVWQGSVPPPQEKGASIYTERAASSSQPFSFGNNTPVLGSFLPEDFDAEKFRVNTQFLTISGTLSYDNYKKEIKSDPSMALFGELGEEVYESLYQAYKTAIVAEEDAVTAAYKYIKKAHTYRVQDALYVANDKKYKNENGDICYEDGKCFEEIIFNRGLLRAYLRLDAGLDDTTNKKWQWNSEIMISKGKTIYNLIMEFGVAGSDIPLALKFLRHVVEKTGDFCDNDVYMADIAPGLAGGSGRADARTGKERRKAQCENLSFLTLALGSLENISSADKDTNADLIYKQLKSNYKEDYGPIVLGNYVTALIMIGTSNAFNHIEKFLLEESLADGLRKGSFWQVIGKVFDIISIKAWVDKFTDTNNRIRGRGGRYLNEAGIRFQYIDEAAAKEMGYSSWSVTLAKDGHTGYNIPYGNILEDIGSMLSSYPDSRAKSIANKVVAKYARVVRTGDVGYEYVHTPLVIGAIKGGGVNNSEDVRFALNKIYNFDWWDLNEGTQRRINNVMAKMSQHYGAGYKAEKSKDDIKKNRAARNERIGTLAVWGDMLVSAILITTFVASIPSLVRGGANFFNTMRATRAVRNARLANIKAAGKTNLLKTVHANIKASGVKPAQVKAAVQERAAVAAAEAAKIEAAAPKPTPLPKPNTTPSASSIANKHRAIAAAEKAAAESGKTVGDSRVLVAPVAGKEGTAQIILVDRATTTYTTLGQKATTLTATVGEGGGGGSIATGASKFTKAQRLFRAQQDAAYELRLVEEALELATPAASTPFKGGWFFNKPYNQLPKWKQTVFNQYYFKFLPAMDVGSQSIHGAIRNPVKSVMGLSVPVAPSVAQIASPTAIYAPIAQGARTSFSMVEYVNAANSLKLASNVSTTTNALKTASNTGNLARTVATTAPLGAKPFTLLSLPQIEGILNEFHGGPSAMASTSNTFNTGAMVIRAIDRQNQRASIRRKFEKHQETPAAGTEAEFATVSAEMLQTASIQNISAVAPLPAAPMTILRNTAPVFDAKGEGFQIFENAVLERFKKRSNSKINKERHEQLVAISRFISPKLAKELIGIVDNNPYGYETFDAFYELIADAIPGLRGNEIITIEGLKLPSIKNSPLSVDAVRRLLEIHDNPFDDMFYFVGENTNFMVTSLKERTMASSALMQQKVLESLVQISLQKDLPGAPGNPYLVGLTGDAYEWENFANDNSLALALGKEIRRDLVKELSPNKKTKISYKEFLTKHKEWLVEKLGATQAAPAVWFLNSEGTYFIYSNDGKTRIRVGGHETLLSRSVNYHFHLEYLNATDGSWTGPINYSCRWFSQDLLPSDVIRDMIDAPIEYMEKRAILVKKSDFKPAAASPFVEQQSGVINTPERFLNPKTYFAPEFYPTIMGTGNGFFNINTNGNITAHVDASSVKTVTETRAADNPAWLANNAGADNISAADPFVLASFFLLPWFKKSAINNKTVTKKTESKPVAKEQSFSSVVPDEEGFGFESQDGYGLTYVDSKTGKEIVLPVNVTMDGRIPAKGYNRIVFNEQGIAELRNHDKKPAEMSHFYMKFDNSTGKFAHFVASILRAKLPENFKIKIEEKANGARKVVKTQLYFADYTSKPLPIEVEIDAKLLPAGHRVVVTRNGQLGLMKEGPYAKHEITPLSANIRLPKNQIPNMVAVLNNSPESYDITVAPTQHKANVIIRDVSLTNVSLGKTFAPVVKESLGMSEANTTALMFSLSYLLPGLSSFLNPVLQRFGEKNVLLASLIMSTMAGVIAVSAGFYGFVGESVPSTYRTYAFATAVLLMASAGILKQLVSNMLIRANRGDTSDKKAKENKAAADARAEERANSTVSFADLQKRAKEVLKNEGKTSLQDAFFYNLSFIWKNAGTLLFLALPYAVNEGFRLLSGGVDLGLDFSLSFPIYALYSGATTYRVYKSNLRDAYEKKKKASEQTAQEKKDTRSVMDVFLHEKGVLPVALGMVFATVHEFVLSSSFASTLNTVFDDGAAANFWVALCLYVPLVFGRLFIGNIVGQRISPSSLYMLSSALSAAGTAMMMGTDNIIMTMAGASIASLGVGNFFTQMYDYITTKHRSLNREISVILALTMTVAAILSTPVRYIAESSAIANIDLILAISCLGASLLLTLPMLKDSSITRFIMQKFYNKNDGNNRGSNGRDNNRNDNRGGNNTPPVDMKNPLPN